MANFSRNFFGLVFSRASGPQNSRPKFTPKIRRHSSPMSFSRTPKFCPGDFLLTGEIKFCFPGNGDHEKFTKNPHCQIARQMRKTYSQLFLERRQATMLVCFSDFPCLFAFFLFIQAFGVSGQEILALGFLVFIFTTTSKERRFGARFCC